MMKINDYDVCEGADLSDADLSYADLSDANLRGADLSDANLRGADLRGAILSDANLHGAILSDANLRGADLSGANLCGAILSDANLRDADLSDANLRGADLSDADLNVSFIQLLGFRSDGYLFYTFRPNKSDEPLIIAGCRYLKISEAIEHWQNTRGGTQLGKESLHFCELAKQWWSLHDEQ